MGSAVTLIITFNFDPSSLI